MTGAEYRDVVMDNARWQGFAFRDGDIVISTPPKCGTTWTQTICALLVFGEAPSTPMDQLSPWLDMLLEKREDVVARLESQAHRRFIKSHTPLDGLPVDPRATYLTVARDPRDVAISMDNHIANMDLVAFIAQRQEAVGLDDIADVVAQGAPVRSDDGLERFWQWIDSDEQTLTSLRGTLHHLRTFWDARREPNVVLLHYDDLKADLEGQMRALATRLGIDVPDARWPGLVKMATFDEMRSRADSSAPNTTRTIWQDNAKFFHSGTSGQWRALLDDDGVRRYRERVAALSDDDAFVAWVHHDAL